MALGFRLLGVLAVLGALIPLSLMEEGVAQVDTQPFNSARILASKHPLSQYAVEDMDYVSRSTRIVSPSYPTTSAFAGHRVPPLQHRGQDRAEGVAG